MEQDPTVTLESVLIQARQLSVPDIVRLIEAVLPDVGAAVGSIAPTGLRGCHGLFSDLGQAPSNGDIDEIRQEMFRGFPRADAA